MKWPNGWPMAKLWMGRGWPWIWGISIKRTSSKTSRQLSVRLQRNMQKLHQFTEYRASPKLIPWTNALNEEVCDAKVQAYSTQASNIIPHRWARNLHCTPCVDGCQECSSNRQNHLLQQGLRAHPRATGRTS